MGTTSSSLFAAVGFSGVSKYSTDFQSVLTRASAIAGIPVTALTNKNADIATRDTSLTSLNSAVAGLGTVLTDIGLLGAGKALTASTTDATAVTATITGTTSPASYSISNVTSIASSASETTNTGYADSSTASVSSTGKLSLILGGNTYSFTLAAGANNLAGLRDAINNLNVGATASVLTTGSGSTGTYLSLSANSTGATALKLIDDPTGTASNILTSANQGSNSVFQLNGIAVSRSSAVISDVIPGVTLNVLGKTTAAETVGIAVIKDTSKVAGALNSLVAAYNTLADQVNSQIGPAAGLLSGNNVIYQIRQALSQIVHTQGTGPVSNLANLGIEVGSDGHISLNQTTFAGLSDSQFASSFALFGSSTTGIGGIQAAFKAISASGTGTIAAQLAADRVTTQRVTAQIATLNARIKLQQTTLLAQLEAADAAIASLTSQQSLLTSSIQSLNFTSFGYQSQPTG
jgi:flagellar hook-associated protein 2